MADSAARLALTPEAEEFVALWRSADDYIPAHTSGSTGTPKPVCLLKRDMRASAEATLRFFGLGAGDTLFLPLSPDYIAGKMQIVRALIGECDLHTEPPSNRPFRDFDGTVRGRSMIAVVPSQVEALLESPLAESLTYIIVGGAAIPPHTEGLLMRIGAESYATYGMTETCSHVALRKIGSEVYRALPGVHFSTDPRGCLIVETDTLSVGRVVTNDVVTLLSHSEFLFRGRADNVINSGGLKIHPEELEAILLPVIPTGSKLYVTSRPSERWGEEAVVVTDWPGLTMDTVRRSLASLPQSHLPKDIVLKADIPLTSSGKIIREKMR